MYKPEFRITAYLLNLVSEISALRAWIENATVEVSWLPVLQLEARARATHSSTSIEGNPLSLPQVKAVARGEKVGQKPAHEIEVSNYLKGLRWVEQHQNSDITEKALLKLHQILTKELLPEDKCGHYKKVPNYIINEKGIKMYSPPSPHQTPSLVKDLIDWLNELEITRLSPIIVCAVAHHQLVSIHPFSDGNGRLARLLGTWILYQRELDTRHIFSLDDFFAGNRQKYYQKIQQARELDGDLTYWIEYVSEGIKAALLDVKKRIESLQVTSRYKVRLTPRQEDLLRILRDSPPLGVAELQRQLSLTRARINQLLAPLLAGGLVTKEGRGKATRYLLSLDQ